MTDTAELLARVLQQSLAQATRSEYQRRWTRFVTFCGAHQLQALPADETTIAAFLASLVDQQPPCSLSTVRTYLAAIRRVHADADQPLPQGSHLLRNLQRATQRIHDQAVQRGIAHHLERHAVPAEAIRRALHRAVTTQQLVLETCAVGVAFVFMLRARAVMRSSPQDWRIIHHDALPPELRLREWHNKVERHQGRTLLVTLNSTELLQLAELLSTVKDMRPAAPYLFSAAEPTGPADPPGSAQELTRYLHAVLQASGEDTTYLSSHSLRAGGACAALAAHVPEPAVMRWGGWSSVRAMHPYTKHMVSASTAGAALFAFLPTAAVGLSSQH